MRDDSILYIGDSFKQNCLMELKPTQLVYDPDMARNGQVASRIRTLGSSDKCTVNMSLAHVIRPSAAYVYSARLSMTLNISDGCPWSS